jgi:hypothetical protein
MSLAIPQMCSLSMTVAVVDGDMARGGEARLR